VGNELRGLEYENFALSVSERINFAKSGKFMCISHSLREKKLPLVIIVKVKDKNPQTLKYQKKKA